MADKETIEESNEEFQEVPEENVVEDEKLSENSFDSTLDESGSPSQGNICFLHE
jgi:hypothetical protein